MLLLALGKVFTLHALSLDLDTFSGGNIDMNNKYIFQNMVDKNR
jgi:hypothetical protein